MKIVVFITGMLLPLLSLSQTCSPIQPLSIGDTLPNHVITAYGIQPGRATLIDFWETWCSSCVESLYNLDKLQKQFCDSLQVIALTKVATIDQVIENLHRYRSVRLPELTIIAQDTLLRQYFPHVVISHLVWIDSEHIIRAITGSEVINVANLQNFIRRESLDLPVKIH